MKKRLLIQSLVFYLLTTGCSSPGSPFPPAVEANLKKAGTNRPELEKAISYFKQSRSNTRFDRKIAEYKQLIATLSPAQFNHYLRLQRQEQATENVSRQWENLLTYKLVEQKDHNRVINERYAYKLKLLVATEWVYINNFRKHVFARRDITDNKPELLKQLDAARKKEAESKIVRF